MNQILISGLESCYRIIVLKNGVLDDLSFDGTFSKSIKSSIYLARVTKIEPSLQAAFVDFGGNKSGFVPFSEIHPIYYNNNKSIKEIIGFNYRDEFFKRDNNELKEIDNDEKNNYHKPKHLIQDVIKVGQILLVQVFRDEKGNKGPSMTTYLTIATRYYIMSPNNPRLHGISKKILDAKERERLGNIVSKFEINENYGLVIRTAAVNANEKNLLNDYNNAINLWNNIVESVGNINLVGLVMKSDSAMARVIKDNDLSSAQIYVDDVILYNETIEICSKINIDKNIVNHYTGSDLFAKFNAQNQIEKLYQSRVDLSSGAYLVINYTEALVSIDVNSGKLTKERDVEKTALKTNLDACYEICKQLKLRDIGGLIVIDFIDMNLPRHREEVENAMRTYISSDKAMVQFTNISIFGLMEISRQRLKTSFIETSTVACPSCSGTGRMFSSDVLMMEILKNLGSKLLSDKFEKVEIHVSNVVALKLNSMHSKDISEFEFNYRISMTIVSNDDFNNDKFIIYGLRDSEKKEIMQFNGISERNANNDDNNENQFEIQNVPIPIMKNDDNRNISNRSDFFNKKYDNRRKRNKINIFAALMSIFGIKKKDNNKFYHKKRRNFRNDRDRFRDDGNRSGGNKFNHSRSNNRNKYKRF